MGCGISLLEHFVSASIAFDLPPRSGAIEAFDLQRLDYQIRCSFSFSAFRF